MIRRPPSATLFPCATLFQSSLGAERIVGEAVSEPSPIVMGCSGGWRRKRRGTRLLRRSTPRSGRSSTCRSEEHTSELQSRQYLVCRLLLEKKTRPIKSSY